MIRRLLPLLARPSRQGAATLILPAVAFTCVTLLLALVIGGAQTFWGYDDELAPDYWMLASVALALLVVPLVSLGNAAARLSARRRDDRLALLRLLGLSSRETTGLAIAEATGVAAAGAITGAALSYLFAPLVGLLEFHGAPLTAAGVMLPAWLALVVVLAVTGVAALSAFAGLRRVNISPLGVAMKQQAPKLRWLPAVIAVVAVFAASQIADNLGRIGDAGGVIAMALGLGAVFAVGLVALDLIGAWLLGVFGRGRLKRASTPEELLAARQILEAPRTAWRQVSGVAMACFVAVAAGSGLALTEHLDQVDYGQQEVPLADIRTGILVTVIGSFLMVACSVGVNQAAQILDRRDVTRSLAIMGTPFAVQERARRKSVFLPLMLAAVGAAIAGGVLVLPILGMAVITAPVSLAVIFASLVGGALLVRVAVQATRPLLRTAAAA